MASLNDICYEQIKDNFYYGIFGDFKLVVDKNTGCFNATKLCSDGGKHFYKWTRLEKSKNLLKFYEVKNRPPNMEVNKIVYEIRGVNKNDTDAKITGQYVQKELILDIASWISVEFYDKCNEIIVDFFVNEFKIKECELKNEIKLAEEKMLKMSIDNEVIVREKDDKIADLQVMMNEMKIDHRKHMEDAERRHKEIIGYAEHTKDQLDHLTDIVEDHNETLPDKFADVVKPLADNFVQSPDEKSLKARFAVLNIGGGEYRVARGQTRNVARVKAEHQKATVLLDLPLVGAQDRMTEVRKQIIKDGKFGGATFKSSIISHLNAQFETEMLQTILEVHEQFHSIPDDMIKQARQELSIVVV
jgi:ribosomal protein L21